MCWWVGGWTVDVCVCFLTKRQWLLVRCSDHTGAGSESTCHNARVTFNVKVLLEAKDSIASHPQHLEQRGYSHNSAPC